MWGSIFRVPVGVAFSTFAVPIVALLVAQFAQWFADLPRVKIKQVREVTFGRAWCVAGERREDSPTDSELPCGAPVAGLTDHMPEAFARVMLDHEHRGRVLPASRGDQLAVSRGGVVLDAL
jgi:hypothetical protein